MAYPPRRQAEFASFRETLAYRVLFFEEKPAQRVLGQSCSLNPL
jgi:hypothetical protein